MISVVFYHTEKERSIAFTQFLKKRYILDFSSLLFIGDIRQQTCSIYHGDYRCLFYLHCLSAVESRDVSDRASDNRIWYQKGLGFVAQSFYQPMQKHTIIRFLKNFILELWGGGVTWRSTIGRHIVFVRLSFCLKLLTLLISPEALIDISHGYI